MSKGSTGQIGAPWRVSSLEEFDRMDWISGSPVVRSSCGPRVLTLTPHTLLALAS